MDPDLDEEVIVRLCRLLLTAGSRAAELSQREGLAHLLAEVDRASADLLPGDAEILGYSLRLTWAPRTMRAEHLSPLRAAGFSDDEIHDINHVVCCFNYMNRLADGLGVVQVREDWAVRLLGEEALARHLEWAADPRERTGG